MCERGESVSDTDGEVEEDMGGDVASRDGVLRGTRKQGGAARKREKTRERKRKEAHAEDSDDEEDDENDGDGDRVRRNASGPLSKEALQEVRDFGEQTIKAAEALALKYRKSTRSIIVTAGLGVDHSRHSENFCNKFKRWYKHKHPMPEDSMYYVNPC